MNTTVDSMLCRILTVSTRRWEGEDTQNQEKFGIALSIFLFSELPQPSSEDMHVSGRHLSDDTTWLCVSRTTCMPCARAKQHSNNYVRRGYRYMTIKHDRDNFSQEHEQVYSTTSTKVHGLIQACVLDSSPPVAPRFEWYLRTPDIKTRSNPEPACCVSR